MTTYPHAPALRFLALGASLLAGLAALGCGASQESLVETDDGILGPTTSGAEYPEAVRIDLFTSAGAGAGCSGVVIAPRVVLTAGHCVFGMARATVNAPFAGDQVRMTDDMAVYDYVPYEGGFINPDKHDVGLLFLKKPIVLEHYPRCSDRVTDGALAVTVGRRAHGEGTRANKLVVSASHRIYPGAPSFPGTTTRTLPWPSPATLAARRSSSRRARSSPSHPGAARRRPSSQGLMRSPAGSTARCSPTAGMGHRDAPRRA